MYAVGLNGKRKTMRKSSWETVKLKQMAKKTGFDFTVSGLKSKKLIILVLLRISAQPEFFLHKQNLTIFQCTFSGFLLFAR